MLARSRGGAGAPVRRTLNAAKGVVVAGADSDGVVMGAVLDARAAANARAHVEQWDVLLPVARTSGAVRVEWDAGPAAVPTLGRVTIASGGSWVSVHSRRPEDEARGWVERELGRKAPSVVCVIGAGVGHVVEVLLDRIPRVRVLVLEPEPELVPWFLARRDWRDAIGEGRLLIVPGPDFVQRMSAWRLLSPVPDFMPVLTSPVIAAARPDGTAAARQVATFALQGAMANAAAGERFGGAILLNTLRNLPVIAREALVTGLAGLFSGKVAAVAGAGPSLNRNIEELRRYRDRVVLVAAGTALKPLVEAGLAPDIVVAVDPGEYTHHQFDEVRAPDTFLAADPSIDPVIFEGFRGRTFLFRIGQAEPWPILLRHGVEPGPVRTWGTVITCALHLAVQMGCDPIVFIGTDLAYTSGQSHARGTFTHGWMKQWMVDRGTPQEEDWTALQSLRVPVVGLDGNEVFSSPAMVQSRDWLCHESVGLSNTLVNATGAGILGGGRVASGEIHSLLTGRERVSKRALDDCHRAGAGSLRGRVASACRSLAEDRPSSWTTLADVAALGAVCSAAQAAIEGMDRHDA